MIKFTLILFIFILTGILKEVIDKCTDGASVINICEFGDNRLIEETGKVFRKDKEMKKGITKTH